MTAVDYSKICHKYVSTLMGNVCNLCGRGESHALHVVSDVQIGTDYAVEKEFARLRERLATAAKDVCTLHEINDNQKRMIERLQADRPSAAREDVRQLSTSPSVDVRYRQQIRAVLDDDAARLLQKDEEYGASWKRRGGVGAFMMMARKIDRLMAIIPEPDGHPTHGFDMFAMLLDEEVGGSESLLDTTRDLRGYLTLIEAEFRVRKSDLDVSDDSQPTTHRRTDARAATILRERSPMLSAEFSWRTDSKKVCHCGRQQLEHTHTVECDEYEKIDQRVRECAELTAAGSHRGSPCQYCGHVEQEKTCSGTHDDGIADGNLTRCSRVSGCGLKGCPYDPEYGPLVEKATKIFDTRSGRSEQETATHGAEPDEDIPF